MKTKENKGKTNNKLLITGTIFFLLGIIALAEKLGVKSLIFIVPGVILVSIGIIKKLKEKNTDSDYATKNDGTMMQPSLSFFCGWD